MWHVKQNFGSTDNQHWKDMKETIFEEQVKINIAMMHKNNLERIGKNEHGKDT